MKKTLIRTYLKWEDIVNLCKSIAESIYVENIKIDQVVAVGRGGMIPARILSELLGTRKIGYLDVHSYNGTHAGKVKIENLPEIYPDAKNILFIDDCFTTGETLSEIKTVMSIYPKLDGHYCFYAALFINKYIKFKHFKTSTWWGAEYNGRNEWLVFPWENDEIEDAAETL